MGREGHIIRKTLIPATYYTLAAGLLGMALIRGGMNLWNLLFLAWVALFLAFMAVNRGRRVTARP